MDNRTSARRCWRSVAYHPISIADSCRKVFLKQPERLRPQRNRGTRASDPGAQHKKCPKRDPIYRSHGLRFVSNADSSSSSPIYHVLCTRKKQEQASSPPARYSLAKRLYLYRGARGGSLSRGGCVFLIPVILQREKSTNKIDDLVVSATMLISDDRSDVRIITTTTTTAMQRFVGDRRSMIPLVLLRAHATAGKRCLEISQLIVAFPVTMCTPALRGLTRVRTMPRVFGRKPCGIASLNFFYQRCSEKGGSTGRRKYISRTPVVFTRELVLLDPSHRGGCYRSCCSIARKSILATHATLRENPRCLRRLRFLALPGFNQSNF